MRPLTCAVGLLVALWFCFECSEGSVNFPPTPDRRPTVLLLAPAEQRRPRDSHSSYPMKVYRPGQKQEQEEALKSAEQGGHSSSPMKVYRPRQKKEDPEDEVSGSSIEQSSDSSTSSRNLAKQKLNQALLLATRIQPSPSGKMVAVGGASALIFEYLRRNRHAARRAFYFWRRAGPIVAHYRFTQWWLERTSADDKQHRDKVYANLHDRYCQPSLEIILHLKGLYVKIGQVLSARPDFVPIQYVELFSTVQDAIPPWPIEEVEAKVREALRTERGLEWEDVFESMDAEALGSASIGQVHRAILKSPWEKEEGYQGGKVVAVKVMSPGAESRFAHDFQVFRWLTRVALPGWKTFLQEFERQLMTEFDYQNEAKSLDDVRNNMAQSRFNRKVQIPQPVINLCCKHLLVMEMIEGKKLADSIEDRLVAVLGGDKVAAQEFLKRKREGIYLEKEVGADSFEQDYAELIRLRSKHHKGIIRRLFGSAVGTVRLLSLYRTTRRYVDLLVDVHGHQIFINGVFNGDPHPGNCLELSNGKLGLIDYGQTKRIDDSERLSMARVVYELGKKPVNTTAVASAMRECGFETQHDKDEVIALYAALFFDNDIEAKRLGCATPQLYLLKLAEMDPLRTVPDAAVFVARTSFLFRGMGSMLDEQVQTAKRWCKYADEALQKANRSSYSYIMP